MGKNYLLFFFPGVLYTFFASFFTVVTVRRGDFLLFFKFGEFEDNLLSCSRVFCLDDNFFSFLFNDGEEDNFLFFNNFDLDGERFLSFWEEVDLGADFSILTGIGKDCVLALPENMIHFLRKKNIFPL